MGSQARKHGPELAQVAAGFSGKRAGRGTPITVRCVAVPRQMGQLQDRACPTRASGAEVNGAPAQPEPGICVFWARTGATTSARERTTRSTGSMGGLLGRCASVANSPCAAPRRHAHPVARPGVRTALWSAPMPQPRSRSIVVPRLLHLLAEAFDQKAWHGPNLRGLLRGVTAERAAFRLHPDRHNIWELVLHCAYWKYAVRRLLTG